MEFLSTFVFNHMSNDRVLCRTKRKKYYILPSKTYTCMQWRPKSIQLVHFSQFKMHIANLSSNQQHAFKNRPNA